MTTRTALHPVSAHITWRGPPPLGVTATAEKLALEQGWGDVCLKPAFFFLLILSHELRDEWGDTGGDFKKQGFTLRPMPEQKEVLGTEAGPFSQHRCLSTACTSQWVGLTKLVFSVQETVLEAQEPLGGVGDLLEKSSSSSLSLLLLPPLPKGFFRSWSCLMEDF